MQSVVYQGKQSMPETKVHSLSPSMRKRIGCTVGDGDSQQVQHFQIVDTD